MSSKRTMTNEEQIELWNHCLEIVSAERLDELEETAVKRAKEIATKVGVIGYGYSGGKDSLVLANIMKVAGLESLPHFCSLYAFEYPVMDNWLLKNAPAGTDFVKSELYGVDFLNKNPRYLFPDLTDTKVRYEYTRSWRPQEVQWVRKNKITNMFYGRRIDDGNYCGKKEDGIYVNRNLGVPLTSWHIIADWKLPEVMAYMKSRELELPPIYDFPKGWRYGTHAWTERNLVDGSVNRTFEDVYAIDKEAVINAAKDGLIAAQDFLKLKGVAY